MLYDYLHSGPTKLMLLLPQENDIAKTVAAYAGLKQWGTLQVICLSCLLGYRLLYELQIFVFFQFSYGTKDNSLASNKNLFPRFFRLNPLTITYNRIRAAFVDEFNEWKLDVGLLYYADSYHTEVGIIFIRKYGSVHCMDTSSWNIDKTKQQKLLLEKCYYATINFKKLNTVKLLSVFLFQCTFFSKTCCYFTVR